MERVEKGVPRAARAVLAAHNSAGTRSPQSTQPTQSSTGSPSSGTYWNDSTWTKTAGKKEEPCPSEYSATSHPRHANVTNCRIRYNETWAVLHLYHEPAPTRPLPCEKRHKPAIAESLFVDDDDIWPPEGVLPLRNEDDSLINPEQYTRRAELVYENGPGRGWWSLIHPKQDPDGLLHKGIDWRAIDDGEDWDSLMRWLNGHREATAASRHQSIKERVEFVAKKREEEKTVLGFPGYRLFNVYLDRHWNMVEDKTQLYGPLREESKDWEERLMAVPEGSERLQTVAAKEIDSKLHECGFKKDDRGDEGGGAEESNDGPSRRSGETLPDTKEHGQRDEGR